MSLLNRSGVADAMWARGHASRCDGPRSRAIHSSRSIQRNVLESSAVRASPTSLGLSRGDPRVNFLSQRVVRHELIDGERLTTERIRLAAEQVSRDGAPVARVPAGKFHRVSHERAEDRVGEFVRNVAEIGLLGLVLGRAGANVRGEGFEDGDARSDRRRGFGATLAASVITASRYERPSAAMAAMKTLSSSAE